MSAHTPGPWVFRSESGASGCDDNDMGGIYAPDFVEVCWFGNGTTYYPTEGCPPSEANGRLMAAAPDLLEACIQAEAAIAGLDFDGCPEALAVIRAAIAKAEGRA